MKNLLPQLLLPFHFRDEFRQRVKGLLRITLIESSTALTAPYMVDSCVVIVALYESF